MVIWLNLLYLGFILPFVMKVHHYEEGDPMRVGMDTWLMYGRVTIDNIPTGWHLRLLCYRFMYSYSSRVRDKSDSAMMPVLCIWDHITDTRRFWYRRGLRFYRIRHLVGLGS